MFIWSHHVWWGWKWNGLRVRRRPFDVVMQNFFYLSWSVWDRAGRPKTQLELLRMGADRIRGGVRHRGVISTGCREKNKTQNINATIRTNGDHKLSNTNKTEQTCMLKSALFNNRRGIMEKKKTTEKKKKMNSSRTSSVSGNKMTE